MGADAVAKWVPQDIPEDAGIAMAQRAKQVRLPVYIGVWEWVAWAVSHSTPVHILFGSNLVDVCGVFAPEARPLLGREPGTVVG